MEECIKEVKLKYIFYKDAERECYKKYPINDNSGNEKENKEDETNNTFDSTSTGKNINTGEVINNDLGKQTKDIVQDLGEKQAQKVINDIIKLSNKKVENKKQEKIVQKVREYKKLVDKIKDYNDKAQEIIKKVAKIDFDKDDVKKFEETVKKYKEIKGKEILKKYLLGKENEINSVLKKNAKTYGDYINEINSHKKNVDKLSKEIGELGEKSKELEKEFKDADNKLRKWKKVGPVLDTLDKLGKGLSIVSDAGDLQNEANKAGIKLTDEEALVGATFQNTISDLVSSNPVDEFADKVGDAAKYLAEKFGKKEWADKIDERKDKLTLGGNVKQVVKFAITTDDKTMTDMLEVYDEMYQEEAKNAGVVKKAWAFTKYKVISTGYHFGVMATKGVIKGGGKLIGWVKSWF